MVETGSSGHKSPLTRWGGFMKPPGLRNTKFLESQLSLHFLRKCNLFFSSAIPHPAYPSLKTRKKTKKTRIPFCSPFTRDVLAQPGTSHQRIQTEPEFPQTPPRGTGIDPQYP